MEKENEVVENLFEDEVQELPNAFADLPPVAPVNYEENSDNNNLVNTENVNESIDNDNSQVNYEGLTSESVNKEYIEKEVKENPTAKVVLSQEKDEEISSKEIQELQDIKLRDNSSLKFVLLLGIIFLIAIFIIPVISRYI